MKLAGIDIGTTTISGVVMDARTGRLLEARTAPNPGARRGGPAWERTQDPAAILRAAARMLGAFVAAHRGIAAAGVTGQMHGVLYVDRDGAAVSPLYTWEDGRGNLRGRDGATTAERLAARTGHPMATGYGLVTHAFQRAHRGVPRRAAALCTIGDYVAMRLAGARRPAMDPSNAASLGCFDSRTLRFDEAALRRAGLADGLLPEVAAVPACLGARRGLPPVCAAIGDNQASFLGSVADFDGSALANIGTGSQVSVYVARHRRVAGLDTRPFPGGGWMLVGAPLCGGRALSLLRDFFAGTLRLFGVPPPGDLWARMARVDPGNPGPGRPLTVDARFNGTRADPSARGAVGGIGADNLTPQHLVAAFETAVVRELLDLYARIPAARRATVRRWVGSGNAVRLNPAIRTILRRETRCPLTIPRHREEAAFGAALAAGVAIGRYPGFRAAAAVGNGPVD